MTDPLNRPNGTSVDPLAEILRQVADVAPEPWHPRQFAKTHDIPLQDVAADVEFLWLEGLLRAAPRPGDRYPGVTLTDAGTSVLADPAALTALREGRHSVQAPEAAALRALRGVVSPVISRALLVVNLVVFAAGIFIATGRGAAQQFLAGSGTPAVLEILHRIGSVSAEDIAACRWWRLMTAAFVHGGILHLLMNMSMLAFGFGTAEAMWGRPRYLLIYLMAAFGGNCVAMAWRPSIELPGGGDFAQPVVGASGALCGILASVMVWVALNGRHLPRSAARQMRNGLIVSALLLVFISLFPQVSGLCHLGGALFGAAAAAVLHFHRWGSARVRWAATVAFLALPWAGLEAIEHQQKVDPRWHKVEHRVFEQQFRQRVAETAGESERTYARRVAPVVALPHGKRDAGQVSHALEFLADARPKLVKLADDLQRAGPYHDAEAEREREASRDRANELAAKFAATAEALEKNANTPEQSEAEERAFSRQFLRRLPNIVGRAARVFRDELQPLLEMPAAKREPDAVAQALEQSELARRQLAALTEALGEAGPYGNGDVEAARQAAERYAAARLAQLVDAERCVRAGEKLTKDDEETLRQKTDEAGRLQQEWESLVEHE